MMRILSFLALAALAACAAEKPPFGSFRAGLTPELVNTVDNELLYVGVEGLQVESTVQPFERIGGVINWRTQDNTSEIATEGGVIVATRSLGDDLMSADVSGTLTALRGVYDGGYYPRFITRLDGEYQSEFRTFQCIVTDRIPEPLAILDRSFRTVKIVESCVTPGRDFTNEYWLGADGTMLKSRQWISEGAGYIRTERLK